MRFRRDRPCKPHAACIPAPRPDLHAPLSSSTSAHRQRMHVCASFQVILRYGLYSPSPFDLVINHSYYCQGLPREDETPVLCVSKPNPPWTALPSRIPERVASPEPAADEIHSLALASASSTGPPNPRTSHYPRFDLHHPTDPAILPSQCGRLSTTRSRKSLAVMKHQQVFYMSSTSPR